MDAPCNSQDDQNIKKIYHQFIQINSQVMRTSRHRWTDIGAILADG